MIRPTSSLFIVLLGVLTALPALSVHLGLPALPLLERGLHAVPGQASLTLALFLLGFSLPQLLAGAACERLGRRPVLLAALAVYALGGLGCALAGSLATMLWLRVVQGVGGAAASVVAFAMVRDTAHGVAGRVMLSRVTMVFSAAPILAPALGGALLARGGWAGAYLMLVGLGALLLGVAGVFVPETRQRPPGEPMELFDRFALVLRQRSCLGHALAMALNYGALFSFVASAPLLLMRDLGVTPAAFGLLFALASLGIFAGSAASAWLSGRGVPGAVLLEWALGLSLGASAMLSLLLSFGLLRLAVVVPLMLVVGLCRGLVIPNAMHAVLEPVPQHAAVAASIGLFGQTLMGATAAAVVALLYPALGAVGMTLAMTGFAFAATLALRYAGRAGPGVLVAGPGPEP